jgi:acylphosphatase
LSVPAQTRVHVIIRGRVQGVGYRAFVENEASRRGLTGWVRNRRDGTVVAVFSGRADVLDEMIAACRKGPWGARVDAVDRREAQANDIAPDRQGTAFAVLPTV